MLIKEPENCQKSMSYKFWTVTLIFHHSILLLFTQKIALV